MRYKARAPLRIDFGGGWTDVPVYAEREGGAVLNAAITRYARGVIARPEGDGEGVRRTPLRALRGERGSVSYWLDAPAGAGLGASAAQTVLWATLVRTTIANTAERREIAEMACRIASTLGLPGGKQDEYASALGGITYYTFGESVGVEPLQLRATTLDELRSRFVLVYSGKSRITGSIHQHVWGRYCQGEPSVVGALATLKRLPGAMRDALVACDLESFAELLTENWAQQKLLHPSVTNPVVDEIFDLAVRGGARGGKACGAGGGGCLIFVAAAGQSERLRAALRTRQLRVIDFDFDSYGVHLTKG